MRIAQSEGVPSRTYSDYPIDLINGGYRGTSVASDANPAPRTTEARPVVSAEVYPDAILRVPQPSVPAPPPPPVSSGGGGRTTPGAGSSGTTARSDEGQRPGGSGSGSGGGQGSRSGSNPPPSPPERLKDGSAGGRADTDRQGRSHDDPRYTGAQPVLLDLDGDGLEVSLWGEASFDYDGDGYREATAWAAADDGFLVVDLEADGTFGSRGGDGVIASAEELAFARWTAAEDTDLQALAEAQDDDGNLIFDTTGDGRLTAADASWASMKVWQDLDQDGEVDEGELRGRPLSAVRAVRGGCRSVLRWRGAALPAKLAA